MNYINTNPKLIKNGGRKAIKITQEELKDYIIKAMSANDIVEDNCTHDSYEIAIQKLHSDFKDELLPYIHDFFHCSKKLKKDISKIEFDLENFTITPGEFADTGGNLLGFHTIQNLSFLGCLAGGDWETPVFFVIYHDGKSLRGYIPLCGNPVNIEEKMAIGNDEEADSLYLAEQLGIPDYEYDEENELLDYNWELIEKDIISRIEVE